MYLEVMKRSWNCRFVSTLALTLILSMCLGSLAAVPMSKWAASLSSHLVRLCLASSLLSSISARRLWSSSRYSALSLRSGDVNHSIWMPSQGYNTHRFYWLDNTSKHQSPSWTYLYLFYLMSSVKTVLSKCLHQPDLIHLKQQLSYRQLDFNHSLVKAWSMWSTTATFTALVYMVNHNHINSTGLYGQPQPG